MSSTTFECAKCRHREAETGEIRTTGSGASRFFNLQNHKWGFVSCASCSYTELYKMGGSGKGGTILDILTD